MESIQSAAGIPAGEVRSRADIAPLDPQETAEILIVHYGVIEYSAWPGKVRIFETVISLAAEKGFADADMLRSLIRRPAQTELVRDLVREVIDALGGAGEVLDIIERIARPDREARHE